MRIGHEFLIRMRREMEMAWDWLAPPAERCASCGRPKTSALDGSLCRDCLERIPRVCPPVCQICGKPLRAVAGHRLSCADCAGGRYFRTARAYGLYQGLLRDLIHRFKYRGETRLAGPLAGLMRKAWADSFPPDQPDMVLPVPLAPARMSERGFNQSALLADALSRDLGIRAAGDLLARRTETAQQSKQAGRNRYHNMRGAFMAIRPAQLAGARILLVDDVFTTGATVDSCARALLDAGAVVVDVLVIACGHTARDWLEP